MNINNDITVFSLLQTDSRQNYGVYEVIMDRESVEDNYTKRQFVLKCNGTVSLM